MTVEEIKAALKQMRNEISLLEMDKEEPELEEAWNGVHDAIIALAKLEQKEAKANKISLVNCGNYFHEIGKAKLTKALERGETVAIHIDCIGHSRTAVERASYSAWLMAHYGERLEVLRNASHLGDAYRLKQE